MKAVPHSVAVAISVLALLSSGLLPAAHAAAPAGLYTVGTDTVLDTATHLTWQRDVGPSATWAAAGAYCQGLSRGGFSSNWRLPTVRELQSIVDESVSSPSIDSGAFPGTPSNYFWSSSPYIGGGVAFVVYFVFGTVDYKGTSGISNVRCVR